MALAMEAAISRPWPAQEPPDLALPSGMRRVQFPAMGTTIALLLPTSCAEQAGGTVRALFALWEQTLSRFRPDSELARLNVRAGTPVPVSGLLWEVLTTALEAAQATDGLYDPTLQRQMAALGYDRSFEQVPAWSARPGATPEPGGGWRDIYLDQRRRRVMLPAGVGLDLGGLAKGLAADTALALLQARGVAMALINAGGDLAVHGLPPEGDAWPIAVAMPRGECTVALARGAMATSGIARRHWRQGAEERHHLLDPRTGRPAASDLWSVSVVAARCVQAEAAATAAFVLGSKRGSQFLREQGLAGLLVRQDGRRLRVGAWPASALGDDA